MTASQFQECLRHVICMGLADFSSTFGEQYGRYQWEKYKTDFKGDAGKWISYLDNHNAQLLWTHLQGYLLLYRSAPGL